MIPTRTMVDRKVVSLFLTFCVCLVFCQNELEKRLLLERSFQDAIAKLEDKIEHLENRLIEGISGKDGSIEYRVSNIKISGLSLDFNPDIDYSNGLRATFDLPKFTATGDWWVRYKKWWISITRDGTFTATANKITISVGVTLNPLKVKDCDTQADLSLKINGGGVVASIASFFFKGSFVNRVENDLEDKICEYIMKL